MKNLLLFLGALTLFIVIINVLQNEIVQNILIAVIVVIGIITFFGSEEKSTDKK